MRGADTIVRPIVERITRPLDRCGIMYRVFFRVKSEESISKKLLIKRDSYSPDGKRMQDLLGIRITLYFSDDVELVHSCLKSDEYYVEESVNEVRTDTFCPKVLNIVRRVPEQSLKDFHELKSSYQGSELIDDTYEVQLRTVLSEGWHEVEHDLRYKWKDDWQDYKDYSRLLNGVFATLETSEWSMLSIFDNLAHSHYKSHNWDAMLRNKMRIRLQSSNGNGLSDSAKAILESNKDIARAIFRTPRSKILNAIMQSKFSMPHQYDTVLHIINRLGVKNLDVQNLEKEILSAELDKMLSYLNH